MTRWLNESKNYLIVIFVLSIAYGTSGVESEDTTDSREQNSTLPQLTIPQGTVQGVRLVTRKGRNISGYLGIPYAKPPIGNLRFKSPVEADAWNGTLSATKDPNECPQLSGDGVIGDEDCLYLNVYTPQMPMNEDPESLPVMVFIHGGGFEKGNGGSYAHGPQYLLDKNVVLVSLNYRIGVLGFLSTGDEVSPGNYGLKDMVLALKWVQNNIAHFGGDPRQVTIFGQSTGAGSVELLVLSNSTNGLFHRYIIQSGSALSIRSFRPRKVYASRATELGEYLGCPTDSSTRLVDCLMKRNASEIVRTKSSFYVWKSFPDLVWGPTDEPDVDGAFITETPTDLYASGRFQDLPCITGVVRDEGLILSSQFYVNSFMFEEFLKKFDIVLPYVLQYHNYVKDEKNLTKYLKDYYFNDLNADRKVLLSNLTKLIGDSMFTYPVYNGLQKRLAHAESVEYFYSFEFEGTYSNSYKYSGGSTANYGVAHTDDLLYLFPNPELTRAEPDREMSDSDYEMVDTMVSLWTFFAINGTPSAPGLKRNRGWRPHSREDNYLMIGNKKKVALETHYFFLSDRMQFWKRLNDTKSNEDRTLTSKISSFCQGIWDYVGYIASKILDGLFSWL